MPTKPLDAQAGLYPTGVGKFNSYDLMPGVCILPLAEDPPTSQGELESYSPVVIARLHAPYRIRKLVVGSTKQNNPPVMPSPSDSGAFIFIGGTIEVQTSVNNSLANFDWSVGCNFSFVENCVSRVQDGFVLGSSPVPLVMSQENAQSVGLNAFAPQGQGVGFIGAIRGAGNDAKTGYLMAQTINFYGPWGYNQEAFLPGQLFNDRIVNGDLNVNV